MRFRQNKGAEDMTQAFASHRNGKTPVPQPHTFDDPLRPGDPLWKYHLEAKVVKVTPAIAEQWLNLNIGNRNKKKPNIEDYLRDMEAGSWVLTGQSIIFDSNGHLRDGQNRLLACVKANRSFTTLVIWGISPDAFAFMDRGAKRTLSDILHVEGEQNAVVLAAAAAYVFRFDRGYQAEGEAGSIRSRLTPRELHEVMERHPELRASARWAGGATKRTLVPAHAVYMHWLFARTDAAMADYFFGSLYEGTGLVKTNPIHTLREQLPNVVGRGRQRTQEWYTIKAWNAWGAGKPLGHLKVGKGETFPEIQAPTSQRWLLSLEPS